MHPVIHCCSKGGIGLQVNFKLTTIVYKTKIHHQLEYLDNLLVEYKEPRVLRSSADEFLAIPRTRTVLATMTFYVALRNCGILFQSTSETVYR